MDNITIPRVTPGLPSELLNQRPDLRQAEAQLAATNYNVQSARAAFFPTIELTASGGTQSAALKTLFGPGAWFYSAAASLTQPIFDGGLLEGQLEVQLALRKQALQIYRKAVLSAFADVEKALVAVEQTTLQEQCAARGGARLAHRLHAVRAAAAGRAPSTWSTCCRSSRRCSGRGYARRRSARPAAGLCQPVPGARRRLGAADQGPDGAQALTPP